MNVNPFQDREYMPSIMAKYHVLTVTRGAVSSPLWNPLWQNAEIQSERATGHQNPNFNFTPVFLIQCYSLMDNRTALKVIFLESA